MMISNVQMMAVAFLSLLLFLLVRRDLKDFILPDMYNLQVLLIGLFLSMVDPWQVPDIVTALQAAVITFVTAWGLREIVFHLKKQDPMGLGDIKFMAGAATWVGLPAMLSLLLYASVATLAFYAVRYLITKKGAMNQQIPFGPGLALGLLITLAFGRIEPWLQILI